MRYVLFVLLLAVLVASHCATTSQQAGDQTVCKEEEVTGSHLPKKVCQSPATAKQREMNDQAEMERFQRRSSVNTR